MLEDIIHIPTLGVVPYLHLDVDKDEDSLTVSRFLPPGYGCGDRHCGDSISTNF